MTQRSDNSAIKAGRAQAWFDGSAICAMTLDGARALRDGGIDAIAALNEALNDTLNALPPSSHQSIKLAVGRAMSAVMDETINPAISVFPELDPDEATWTSVVRARASARADS